MIVINDLSTPFKEESSILIELNNAITSELIGLGNSIENGLDFEASKSRGRPIIRFGLDEELDASNANHISNLN